MSTVCKYNGLPLDSMDRCPSSNSYSGCSNQYGTQEDVIRWDGNTGYNYLRGSGLRGRYGSYADKVRLLDGATLVSGDLQVEGDILVKGGIRIEQELQSKFTDMQYKFTAMETNYYDLQARCRKLESFVEYLCSKMNLSIEDLEQAKVDLNKRNTVDKRLDAIL